MEDMEMESDCYTVCYCVIKEEERLDPTISALKAHSSATSDDIPVGTPLGDVITRIKQDKGISDVSWLHTRDSLWKNFTDKHLALRLPKGAILYLKFMAKVAVHHGMGGFVPQGDGSGGSVPPDIVTYLTETFKEDLQKSRKVNVSTVRESGEIPDVIDDAGEYFVIRGRRKTIDNLIWIGASIYGTFLNTAAEDDYKRGVFLYMTVAYPGAGKSTIGSEFPRLLREVWKTDMAQVDALLTEAFKSYPAAKEEYKQVVENSLETFEMCMYHNLVATQSGGLLGGEEGLGAAQVLALRALHGALSSPLNECDYRLLLSRLPGGVKQKLQLNDVVQFIRRVYSIPHEKKIMLSWFFDELNAARGTLRGGEVTDRASTWAQDMLSEYVDWMYRNRGGNTFVIMGGATTRFSAANLCYTKSGRAKAHFLELPPLTQPEAVEVVEIFLSRIFNRPRADCPDWLRLCLEFSGGIPRMIQTLLRASVTILKMTPLERDKLVECLDVQQKTKAEVEELFSNWLALLGSSDYFIGYLDAARHPVLMAALHASLLGKNVTRVSRVLPDSFGLLDEYQDLEAQGIIALSSGSDCMDTTAYPTFAERRERVRFCPLLLFYLMRMDSTVFPGLSQVFSSSGHVKEVADLFIIRLNIWLYFETSSTKEFFLTHILPSDWHIPVDLCRVKFRLAGDIREHRRTRQLKSLEAFLKCLEENPNCSFFSGPKNWASDSWIVLVEVESGKKMYLFIESKYVTDALKVPEVKWQKIRDEAMKGLKMLLDFSLTDLQEMEQREDLMERQQLQGPRPKRIRLPPSWFDDEDVKVAIGSDSASSSNSDSSYKDDDDDEKDENDCEEQFLQLADVAWIYMTDQKVLDEVVPIKQQSEKDDLAKRIIIGARYASGSAWDCASRFRKLISVLRVNVKN